MAVEDVDVASLVNQYLRPFAAADMYRYDQGGVVQKMHGIDIFLLEKD